MFITHSLARSNFSVQDEVVGYPRSEENWIRWSIQMLEKYHCCYHLEAALPPAELMLVIDRAGRA